MYSLFIKKSVPNHCDTLFFSLQDLRKSDYF